MQNLVSQRAFATAMRGDEVTPFSALDLSHHHSLCVFALSEVMAIRNGFDFTNIIIVIIIIITIMLDLIHFPIWSFVQTPGQILGFPITPLVELCALLL